MQPFSFFQKTGMLPQLAYSMHTVPQVTAPAPSSCAVVNGPRPGAQQGELTGNASMDGLVGKITEALSPILNANQQAILDRLTGLDASIRALSQEFASFEHQAAQSNEANRTTIRVLTDRLDRLNKVIGVQYDDGIALSLVDRLDLHGQLLERMKHSQVPPPVRHEMATSTIALPATPRKEYVDTATDPRTPPTDPQSSVNENIRRRSLCLRNSIRSLRTSPTFATPQPELRSPAQWSHPKDLSYSTQSDSDNSPESFAADATADELPVANHPSELSPPADSAGFWMAGPAADELPVTNQASVLSPRIDTADFLMDEPAADEPPVANRASVLSPRTDTADFLTDELAADELSGASQATALSPRTDTADTSTDELAAEELFGASQASALSPRIDTADFSMDEPAADELPASQASVVSPRIDTADFLAYESAADKLPVASQASVFPTEDLLTDEPAADELPMTNPPSALSPRTDTADFLMDEPVTDGLPVASVPSPRNDIADSSTDEPSAVSPRINDEPPAENISFLRHQVPGDTLASSRESTEPHAGDDLASPPAVENDMTSFFVDLADSLMNELAAAGPQIENEIEIQDGDLSFVRNGLLENPPVSIQEPTESHTHGSSIHILDDATSLLTAPESLTELSTTPQEQLKMSIPHASSSHSIPPHIETTSPFGGACPEDIKPFTILSRELSPLSSISSITEVPRTPSPPPRKTATNRIVLQNPTGSTGGKKRKARRKLSGPPTKRLRKKLTVKASERITLSRDIKWPEKTSGDDAFRKTFVQCDRCHIWYHCGCVGLNPGDVRLEPTEIYICPACEGSSRDVIVNKNADRQQECARPDCDHTRQDEFFVERIVGRAPRSDRRLDDERYTMVQKYLWLVKWDGYTIMDATWENDEQMGDSQALVADFIKAAHEEGVDLTKEGITMLWEAEEAGW